MSGFHSTLAAISSGVLRLSILRSWESWPTYLIHFLRRGIFESFEMSAVVDGEDLTIKVDSVRVFNEQVAHVIYLHGQQRGPSETVTDGQIAPRIHFLLGDLSVPLTDFYGHGKVVLLELQSKASKDLSH